MVSVVINGSPSAINGDSLPRMTDLIEVIKDTIDPNHMITEILIDGRDLSEGDWVALPKSLGNVTLEVSTDTPRRYIEGRIVLAPTVIDNCFLYFRETRKAFQAGDSRVGNEILRAAVQNLSAFIDWYKGLLELMNDSDRRRYSIESQVREITPVLQSICNQQLSQSWWATGQTIERELEPKLDKLEGHLRVMIKPLADQAVGGA
jgi:hypothetical protein